MQATRNDIAMARVLAANRGIDGHNSSVQIADAEHNFLEKGAIIGKDGRHQRTAPASNHGDEIARAVIGNQRRYRSEYFDVVDIFRGEPVVACEKRGLNKRGLLPIGVDRLELRVTAK